LFQSYEWPGNVRELKNTIAGSALLPAPDRRAAPSDSIDDGDTIRSLPAARRAAADAFERRYLEIVLARSDGNITRAAVLAGVSRQAITDLLSKHGLRRRNRREG
jgi:two-component system NtrC family response regulator